MSYIRFQTGMRCRSTGRFLGVFHAAGWLEDELRVEPHFAEPLASTLQWFNKNLAVPGNDDILGDVCFGLTSLRRK